jgi:hypothetical protein
MKKLYINDEAADQIVICSLKESIGSINRNIQNLKRKKKISNWAKGELADNLYYLDALEKVYNYYGGNLKK